MKQFGCIIYFSVIVLLCGQVIGQSCTLDTESDDCTNSNLPLCINGVCAACSAGEASRCDSLNYRTPVCDTSTGACVACTDGSQCNFEPTRPVCLNTVDYVGCYECTNTTGECFNSTMGAAPFCHSDGSCGGCFSDSDCLMLFRSTAFVCSEGACVVPIVGPYMIATFVIIGFVILVFIVVISVVASKNKKNRQKRKSRDAAKSERKLEKQPLARVESTAADPSPRKSIDKPLAKEGDKENLITGAAISSPKEEKRQASKSSSVSPDSSSTSESDIRKPVAPAAVAPVSSSKMQEASSSVSGRSRSASGSSSTSESTEEKENGSNSGTSVSSK